MERQEFLTGYRATARRSLAVRGHLLSLRSDGCGCPQSDFVEMDLLWDKKAAGNDGEHCWKLLSAGYESRFAAEVRASSRPAFRFAGLNLRHLSAGGAAQSKESKGRKL